MLLAFVVASAIMMVVESINGKFLYPELGKAAEGVTDREVVRQLMATAPIGALLVVLAGWAVGTVAGGLIVGRVASRAPALHAIIFGVIIAAAGIANNLMLPPPAWFWVAGLVVPIGAGLLTASVVARIPARGQR
jgi:hypothetical protein